MGRIGSVLSWVAAAVSGVVKNDPGGGALVESEHYAASAGEDAPPLPTDFVLTVEVQGTGRTASVGIADGANVSTATPGERRTYARDGDGTIKVTLHLKSDGSARLSNDNGHIELQANGEVNINGATITTSGDVVTASGTSLDGHTHPHGTPNTGPPN